MLEIDRAADGNRPVSRAHGRARAQLTNGQSGSVDLDQRQVGISVATNHFAGEFAPVIERDAYLISLLHDVIVGQYISVGANDHARSGAAAFELARAVIH